MTKGTVYLLTGKVASGKTTFARAKEAQGRAILLSLDALQLSVLGPTPTREQIDNSFEGARAYQMQLALKLLDMGIDVYLDWGLWERKSRQALKQTFVSAGYTAVLIYFCISSDQRMRWNAKRNMSSDTQSYKIEPHDVTLFDTYYEEPSKQEYDVLICE